MTKVPLFASKFRCSLCNEPVDLRTAKTDEDGKVVHEECYVLWIRGLLGTSPPGRALNNPIPSPTTHHAIPHMHSFSEMLASVAARE